MSEVASQDAFGFGKQQRLLKPDDFSAVFAARRVTRGERFALHRRANGGTGARLGLTVPKKLARSAVLRNAIKRQAREVYRLGYATLPPQDLILRLTARVEIIDKPAWRKEIAALFARLHDK